MALKIQDPDETLDWQLNFDADLGTGETVASRQWSITPDASPTLLTNATSESVSISGLTLGTVYRVSQAATTSLGNVLERSFTLRCAQR